MGEIINQAKERIRHMSWRVRAVLIAVAVTVGLTAIPYIFRFGLDPTTHFGAIFAAWVGGVALFVIAGAVVAIISLARPEEESFDARARIFFRGRSGKHIDYIIQQIPKRLEHYAELSEVTHSVRDYDPATKRYLIATKNKLVIKSYLDDVRTTYDSYLDFSECTIAPNGKQRNRLVYLRVGSDTIGPVEEFDDKLRRDFSTNIDPDGSCAVEYLVEHWTEAEKETNDHRPRRYTQAIRLNIENLVNLPATPIQVSTDNGAHWDTVDLPSGQTRPILQLSEVPPGNVVFRMRILPP
jgi:hypothetical protein